MRSRQSMWPLVFVTPFKKAPYKMIIIIIIIIILTCDECLTWRWLCIPVPSEGMGVVRVVVAEGEETGGKGMLGGGSSAEC